MANPFDLGQGFEVRDAAGHSLGFLVPQLVPDLTTENQRLRHELKELQAKLDAAQSECEKLRQDLSEAVAERDDYLKWAYALAPKEEGMFTPEELEEIRKGEGVPMEQVLEEINRMFEGTGNGQ